MNRKTWIIVGLLTLLAAVVVGVGGIAWAAADEAEELPARAPRLEAHLVRGTVTDLDGDRVSVETAQGEPAVLLITDTTRLWLPGQPPTTTVALAIGDPVLALGNPVPGQAEARTLSARLVVVVADEDLPKVLIRGRAVAITEQTIVVQTGQRERALTIAPQSRLLSANGRLSSVREVRPGEQVLALGQPTELGQWIAGIVFLPGSEPLERRGLRGQVTSIDAAAGTLTVETAQRGIVTVLTDKDTRYRIPGIEEPGFDDIAVGAQIVALGHFEKEERATFHARVLAVPQP